MTRRGYRLGLVASLALGLAWCSRSRLVGTSDDTIQTANTGRNRSANGRSLADALAQSRARAAKLPWSAADSPSDSVTIEGTVIDVRTAQPIGGVEVVFRNDAGEETTTAGADGKYSIAVPNGAYRAFVRDDSVMSVGRNDRIRLPAPPTVETVNAPDEALMPLVIADADAIGVDLSVMRGGTLRGRVTDALQHPVAHAVLRANDLRGGFRPTLGTDVAETDGQGNFEMKLPTGMFTLVASHVAYAGVGSQVDIRIEAGQTLDTTITLARGCVITGKVLGAGGKPGGDGALERQWGGGRLQYAPTGRIEPDGTFRWTTIDEAPITLRAWPWKSPPSPEKTFDCKDGARFDNVVFQLPDTKPDIEGVLVDAAGAPVPFAYVDLSPITDGGIGQQERTDAEGKWAVYQMPSGRYQVTATAPGRGVATLEVGSPQTAVRLQLSGTGRIEGTTSLLANGSIEVRLESCTVDGESVAVPQDRRLVAVSGGHFTIDDVPACHLELAATWRDQVVHAEVDIATSSISNLEIAIGPPRAKRVSGVVRDPSGKPAASIVITSVMGKATATTTTDASGHFTIDTFSGARLLAGAHRQSAEAVVGMANVDTEQVDLQLAEEDYVPADDYDDEPDDPS